MKIKLLLILLPIALNCFGEAKIARVGWDSSANLVRVIAEVDSSIFVSYEGGLNPGQSIRWQKDDGELVDYEGTGLYIEKAKFSDSGLYRPWIIGNSVDPVPGQSALVLVGAGDQLSNISTRIELKAGASNPVVGFVIEPGVSSRFVLMRCIGPGLKEFGVDNFGLPQSMILKQADGTAITNYSSVDGDLKAYLTNNIDPKVGAFPLQPGDLAGFRRLQSGIYTIEVTPTAESDGIVLVEFYIFSS